MHLVPIPTTKEHLKKTYAVWFPFLEGISKRSKDPVESLRDAVLRLEVQPIIVWDGNKAVALAGVRRCKRGRDVIAELVWLTGKDRKTWQHLLPELERYLKEQGCVEFRPICRPGWTLLLKQYGYKTTHIMMEKVL